MNNTKKRIFTIIFIVAMVAGLNLTTVAAPYKHLVKDSVGSENKDGKLVVLHKVTASETLYAISRRYQTDVAVIKQANNLQTNELGLGSIIKVPTGRPFAKEIATQASGALQHKVAQGEGLYSIARQYNVSIDDIKAWNKLTDNALHLGQILQINAEPLPADTNPKPKPIEVTDAQRLHTVDKGQTLYSIATMHHTTMANLRQWNNLTTDALEIGQKLIVGRTKVSRGDVRATPTHDNKPREFIQINKADTTTSITGFETIVESGFAAKIEGGSQTRKHLALHRTAQTGTILQVKNEMNGAVVFVRVIGKLPNTGVNSNLLLRISSKAYERLGAADKRIPIIVTYPKP